MGSRAHTPADITRLLQRLQAVRQHSERLIDGLEPEDLCLQGMADASPAKWHLGHTTWFFETFLLEPHLSGHETPDRRWGHLFNSYYEAIGSRHPRPQRGLLTRPAIGEVLAWRRRVDAGLETLLLELDRRPAEAATPLLELVELGLQHEQQHQELLLMDLLDGFSRNPLEPAYGVEPPGAGAPETAAGWRSHPGGLVAIGHDGGGFHFDNEAPRHRQWLEPFSLAETLVTNEAYAAFITDGGYRRPELWMSEGWAVVQERGWCAPRYWRGDWEFSLAGRRPRHPQAPVRHLSWFEADAFARWSGARLPSEAEWELVATEAAQPGGRPLPQAFGALWQWTATPYRPYPGFRPAAGAVGEYNGKFMTSQFVLRGSSFLTPAGHARTTYRNFFAPHCRWMAAGLRLARDGADEGAGGGAIDRC
ncbi:MULTISPECIES: ergothioneine biosynthesis protein EgtB [unclassified Cyanobium]|uniref:ergothioneine biosynthesis protein EgtB n=1 Tax=unclassified Cyanobium TaxID=2627006 RepID=UPI0020CC9125|nr:MULTISPECIES: ergothioneine biosynthesis protein EgtB [unclassified Cyanobium]MCP9834465.1 ergothioneine biosynthesis protein EgtB [Cyanobium sp. La Preciosa 7G6]MCP9937163.1 ergothioneine biosynthesis protein EgtB [Cyanobium sp. Aljojuca 7A6]